MEIETGIKELEGRIRQLATYDHTLLNLIAELGVKLDSLRSECEQFSEQKFKPMKEMVNMLWSWKHQMLEKDKGVPLCPRCEGAGRTWK